MENAVAEADKLLQMLTWAVQQKSDYDIGGKSLKRERARDTPTGSKRNTRSGILGGRHSGVGRKMRESTHTEIGGGISTGGN